MTSSTTNNSRQNIIETLRTRSEEIVDLTLDLLPTALSGDRANVSFYFTVDEETNEIAIDYYYYTGQIYSSDNTFYTIPSYESIDAEELGYDSIEEINFSDCGYAIFIEYAIETTINNLENC